MTQLQLHSGGERSTHLLSILSPPRLSSSNFSIRHWRCFIGRNPRHSRSLSSPPILKVVVAVSSSLSRRNPWSSPAAINAVVLVATAVLLSTPAPAEETLSNVPQNLSGEPCDSGAKECQGGLKRIQRPKSRNAETCTSKCVTTCIRGGDGSPGEGPLNVRGPIVVFKQGFRTRQYCLVECSDICNLLDKADKGR